MVLIIKCRTCFAKVGCTDGKKTLFCDDCETKFCEKLNLEVDYVAKCKQCI